MLNNVSVQSCYHAVLHFKLEKWWNNIVLVTTANNRQAWERPPIVQGKEPHRDLAKLAI